MVEADYAQLEGDMDILRDSLHVDYGINVIDVDDPASGIAIAPDDIWTSARDIWSRVLISVLDAYALAAAIRAEADTFVTGDHNLRSALEQLRDPNDDWAATSESLRNVMGAASSKDFPTPVTPSAPFKL